MSNLEIVKSSYEASAQGDMDKMMSLMTDDISWTEMAGFPYAGTYHGKAELLAGVFARIASEWDGFQVIPNAYYADGETVVAVGTYSGTYKKTGTSFKARFVHIWKVKNKKISDMEQFVDTLLVERAVHP